MNMSEFDLDLDLETETMIEELDTRLEMGIWIFDTHDGTTASCGASF